MREFDYQADCAGLSLHMVLGVNHLAAEWKGYHDSIPTYVRETVSRLKEYQSADVRQIFEQSKEKYIKSLNNHYLQ